MHTDHNANGGRGASVVSRRTFFQIAVAGTAATLPVAASAAVAEKTSRLPQLTDEQQLENCVAQLRGILQRMHPAAKSGQHFWINRFPDGGYDLQMRARIEYQQFSGDGLYEVSLSGHVYEFWLIKDFRYHYVTHEPLPGSEFYWATMRIDGEFGNDTRQLCMPNIVRKIEGAAP